MPISHSGERSHLGGMSIHINRSLEVLLFIDSLRTETAISFLITDFNNNIFVCRSSHFIMCFKKTCLKVSVYPRSSLLEILHPDHEFLRNVTQGNLSVDNSLRSKSQKRVEYVSKTSYICVQTSGRPVNKNSLA